MITFVLWKWRGDPRREQYEAWQVNVIALRLAAMCGLKHRVICVTDDPKDVNCQTYSLWNDHSKLKNPSGAHLPSCFRRLKIFDPATQAALDIEPGTRIVSFDIDAIILRDMPELFHRNEQFVGIHVTGHHRPEIINGSMFMFTAGEHEWLWKRFDPVNSPRAACSQGYMGSDQGYLSHQLIGKPFVGKWTQVDGVLSYWRHVKVPGGGIRQDTKIVFFPGRKKPWHEVTRRESPWIERYVGYPATRAA